MFYIVFLPQAKVVGRFFQIDNRLELMINQQRAEKIPLIHDQDKNKIKNLAFAGFSFIHLT